MEPMVTFVFLFLVNMERMHASFTQEYVTKENANFTLASGLKNALVGCGCQQWCRSWQSTKHMSKISPMYKLLVSSRPPSKADSQSPQNSSEQTELHCNKI